jgi:death-on-curing family protein
MKNYVKIGKSEIVIYKTPSGKTEIGAKLDKNTVWLSLSQIATLFGRDKSAISRHIKNIYGEGELNRNSTVAKFATVQLEGGREITRNIDYYNLDAVISIGYRVNSKIATRFRIWATEVLKNYLVRGYAINRKRLLKQQEKFKELQQAVAFLKEKSTIPEIKTQIHEILSIVNHYADSMTLLFQYDKGEVPLFKTRKPHFILTYETSVKLIGEFKKELIAKGEASRLFGSEVNDKLVSILGAVYQTFNKKNLYGTIEEKAANLLYLVIKDHPFVDGNKRIGSLLFIYFIEKNKYLFKKSGERKISDNALVALALLIANSDPREKEIMINIVTNLLRFGKKEKNA